MKFPRRISLRNAIILIWPLDNLGFAYLPLATYNGLVLPFSPIVSKDLIMTGFCQNNAVVLIKPQAKSRT
jgi:hypothetical protein